jgi:CubicO group peptidase (beta-lactamase class C family)
MNRRAFLATAACGLATASARAQAPVGAARFDGAAAYSAERGGATFLISRHGIVLDERYEPGYAPNSLLPIGAATRVFALLLVASLIEDGLLRLDEGAAQTFTEWTAHPLKNMISVRGLLNGTSGLAFGDNSAGGVLDAIALEPVAPPGERFIDDRAPFLLVTEIARRKLELARREPDPARYLTTHTLEPIGCAPLTWTRGPDGAAWFHDGAAVTARGWAQVGELMRREGVWQAQQIVSAPALREALIGTYAAPRVGMGLWLAAASARDNDTPQRDSDLWRMNPPAPLDLAMASGAGGQRLYVIPSEHLVVVRQSRETNTRNWSDATFLDLVSNDL